MKCRLVLEYLVHFLNKTPKTMEMMAGWDRVIQFDLDDEAKFFVKIDSGKAVLHLGQDENPDATIKAPSSLFMDIIMNKINPDEAYLSRKYEILGSVIDATKFRRLGDTVQSAHSRTFDLFKQFYGITTGK